MIIEYSYYFLMFCRSALKFITWTSTDLSAGDELCVLPPDVSIKVASELGFDSVEYSEISAVEAESHMLAVSSTA